jgi:hypothetical protein
MSYVPTGEVRNWGCAQTQTLTFREQKRRGGDSIDKGPIRVKGECFGSSIDRAHVPEALVLELGCTGLFMIFLVRFAAIINVVEHPLLVFAHSAPHWPFFGVIFDAAAHVTVVHL